MGKQEIREGVSFDQDCPLCKQVPITHWYANGPCFRILDCPKCRKPIIALLEHVIPNEQPVGGEGAELAMRLEAAKFWGVSAESGLDFERPCFPGHLHAHLRET